MTPLSHSDPVLRAKDLFIATKVETPATGIHMWPGSARSALWEQATS
jgi:hypothetical protein